MDPRHYGQGWMDLDTDTDTDTDCVRIPFVLALAGVTEGSIHYDTIFFALFSHVILHS